MDEARIDKWMWAARIFKTRTIAAEACKKGRVCINGAQAKAARMVKPGDVMVAGWNFGCGSSREHAPLVIKTCGTGCVIAKSFARIFYRNAINIGFPIMECPEAAEDIAASDEIDVDFSTGVITNKTKGKTYQSAPFPAFVEEIIAAGGLMNSLKKRGLAK